MRIRLYFASAATAFSCIAIPGKVSAQSIGTLIGANISTIAEAEQGAGQVVRAALDKKKRVGLKGGFFLKIPLTGMFSLEPEVLYVQNGVTYLANAVQAETFDVNLGYVEVPILLRVDLSPKSRIHPILMAGGSGAFRVQCKFDAPSGSTTASRDCDATGTSNDPFKKTDYAVIGAAGVAGDVGGSSASLQLRVTQGVTTISSFETDRQFKNRALSVLLGFKF